MNISARLNAIVTHGSSVAWLCGLWAAFIVAHAYALWSGWVLPNQPMGDVYNVYEPWSNLALNGVLMGVDRAWVYPPVALVPMVAVHLFDFLNNYTIQWGLMVTLCNAIAYAFLIGKGTSPARRSAALMWTTFVLLLGSIGIYRLDAMTVPLAILALLWVVSHPAIGATLLAVGAWIKIWPAAVFLALFAVTKRKIELVLLGVGVSATVVAAVVGLGGSQHLLGFLGQQNDRGLQVEAPISAIYLLGALVQVPGIGVRYNSDIVTFQVYGPGADFLASVMTPLMGIVALALTAFCFLRVRGGASARLMLPPLAFALVLTFIVVNKVGSPQFASWLIPALVLWVLWNRVQATKFAFWTLASAILTQLIYPVFYDRVLHVEFLPVMLLVARNAIYVGMLIAVVRLLLQPVGAKSQSYARKVQAAFEPGPVMPNPHPHHTAPIDERTA